MCAGDVQRGGALGGVARRLAGRARRTRGERRARRPRALPRAPPAGRCVRAALPLSRRHLRTALRLQLLRTTHAR